MLRQKNGFTLIEILVVLGIISLLLTMSIVAVRYARERARIAKAQNETSQIMLAISMLGDDTGQWPGHQPVNRVSAAGNQEVCGQDINGNNCASQISDISSGLIVNDAAPNEYPSWAGPYMTEIPLDPWGNEYFFDTDYMLDIERRPCQCSNLNCANAVVVGSYGPDGKGKPDAGIDGAFGCDDIVKIIVN